MRAIIRLMLLWNVLRGEWSSPVQECCGLHGCLYGARRVQPEHSEQVDALSAPATRRACADQHAIRCRCQLRGVPLAQLLQRLQCQVQLLDDRTDKGASVILASMVPPAAVPLTWMVWCACG